MSQIKVSVIIPVYNTEKYLVKCLVSVLNQSLREIEIICINDCSTDNSDEIINKYVNDNIHYYSAVNRSKYLDLICNEYDILVNIGNDCELQEPSKMFELLSTGLPILNFYYRKDSQFEIIEKYPLGINVRIDGEIGLELLESFCNNNKNKQLPFREVVDIFPEYSLDYQLEKLEKIMLE